MKKYLVICFMSLMLAGCLSGGGGGGGGNNPTPGITTNSDSNSGNDYNAGSTNDPSTSPNVKTYHNPEPASMIMLTIGLAGLAAARFLKKKRS